MPGWHSLHHGILADYLLGWGRASTCTAGHTKLQRVPMSKLPCGLQELPPSTCLSSKCAQTLICGCPWKHHSVTPHSFAHAHAPPKNALICSTLVMGSLFSRPHSCRVSAVRRRWLPCALRAHCAHACSPCVLLVHMLSANVAAIMIIAGGHTASNAPDLFRPPKLSGAGPG